MPYTRRTWANSPATTTPITAAALNNIEDGVEQAVDALGGYLAPAELSDTIAESIAPVSVEAAAAVAASESARSLARRGFPDKLAPIAQMIVSAGTSGHGIVSQGAAGSTFSLNDTSTYSLGTQSAKVVTDAAGGYTWLTKSSIPTIDMTGKYVRIWLRMTNVSRVGNVYVYLGDSTLTNSFRASIYTKRDPKQSPFKDNQWQIFDIPWSAFSFLTGSPSRSAIAGARVQISDSNEAVAATVHFGGLAAIAESSTYPNGVVSLTFDDCYEAADTVARLKMDTYGYAGTFYPIIDQFGGAGKLTLARAKAMEKINGWDFGFHATTLAAHSTGFDTLTEAQLETEFETMIAWASENDVRGDSLAWPLVNSSLTAERVAANYFSAARGGLAATVEMVPPSSRMFLRSIGATNTTTAAQLKAWVDQAKSGKGWVVFTFHDIKASGLGANDTTPTIFNELVDYIAAQGVPVRTVAQVMRSPQNA